MERGFGHGLLGDLRKGTCALDERRPAAAIGAESLRVQTCADEATSAASARPGFYLLALRAVAGDGPPQPSRLDRIQNSRERVREPTRCNV